MIAEPLRHVLETTGYLVDGEPAAPSVILGRGDRYGANTYFRRPLSFEPEVQWRSSASLNVYFKYVPDSPNNNEVGEWQREVWNQGFAPLLWVVSPETIVLYNGFGLPQRARDVDKNLLKTFGHIETELNELNAFAGRLAMETGQFWRGEKRVSRETSVDRHLLRDLGLLERKLIKNALPRDEAQGLIGRSIFANYLIDRKIVSDQELQAICGQHTLPNVLDDRSATVRLFEWFHDTFNGDMFPSAARVPEQKHLEQVARFLRAEDLKESQLSLFPYQFDVIPVELISAIYEQFVHSGNESTGKASTRANKKAKSEGIYYTPLPAVSLVLDEVMDRLTGNETILDLTCGSGVFLVEGLRRLVYLKSDGKKPNRRTIRETLYKQVYGVDKSKAAVQIAAFSLYLAALELDPDPRPPKLLRFEPLEGNTLLVGDAREIERTPAGLRVLVTEQGLKKFDVIVGNPPWSYRGKKGTAERQTSNLRPTGTVRQPRGESLDFVTRATDFAHHGTRFGMILSATPFFSVNGVEAARTLIETLSPVTLVNLSDLSGWLFPKANMPAVAFLARHRDQRADRMTLVQASWSLAGEQSHTFEIAPSDVTTLPIASWKRNQGLFKAAFLGRHHDLLLLDDLWEKHESLEARLGMLGSRLRSGLILGVPNNRTRDASPLRGLPYAERGRVRHFLVPDDLHEFTQDVAQWPREREIYRAPLLLVNKFMQGGPRLVTAIVENDTVFSDAYYGASFTNASASTASLVAGILSSALASWYFLMTGSAFGIWMRQLKLRDVAAMPTPDLDWAVQSDGGRHIVQFLHDFRGKVPDDSDWDLLDNAVFDLYGLNKADRVVVRDGLIRASWQWKRARVESAEPADDCHLSDYARAFVSSVDAWLYAANERRLRAEIFEPASSDPLRAIRFVLEDHPPPSTITVVRPLVPLREVLARIGADLKVPYVDAPLVGKHDFERRAACGSGTVVCPASRCSHFRPRACMVFVRSDPNRLLELQCSSAKNWFFRPCLTDRLPLLCSPSCPHSVGTIAGAFDDAPCS